MVRVVVVGGIQKIVKNVVLGMTSGGTQTLVKNAPGVTLVDMQKWVTNLFWATFGGTQQKCQKMVLCLAEKAVNKLS